MLKISVNTQAQKSTLAKHNAFYKADGGVGLVDIELKFKALKAAWSKILVNKDCVSNHIMDSYLGRFQIDFNCILSLSEIKSSNFTIIEHLPVFYQEIQILCLTKRKSKD